MPDVSLHLLAVALIASIAFRSVDALAVEPEAQAPSGVSVSVRGAGRPVLMIPGLNSASAVWDETCAALQPEVECHLVSIPGFAGAPAQTGTHFLEALRDQLRAYLERNPGKRFTVMGHSLGGTVALMLAADAKPQIDQLIIVDALPYLGALSAPNASAESVRANAERMRSAMEHASAEQRAAQMKAMLKSMVHDPARQAQLADWSQRSDSATAAQALYELWTTDLRSTLLAIDTPTLVLGSWAAYAPMGATPAGTAQLFAGQYQGLRHARIEISQAGYHFLMWDDGRWLVDHVRQFLNQH